MLFITYRYYKQRFPLISKFSVVLCQKLCICWNQEKQKTGKIYDLMVHTLVFMAFSRNNVNPSANHF